MNVSPLKVIIGVTVNVDALSRVPLAVDILMFPLLAVAGTIAVICVSELMVNSAGVSLNFTAVAPLKLAR
jgi:hypothetical protein